MMLETIDHGRVRELRLARPPVNALDPELVETLITALEAGARECGALVLSGREGMFSAGLDVPALLQLDRAGMSAFWGQFFRLLETLARSTVPVVAAITGHAPAGGAVISLFCDYRVMTDGQYRIGLNETQVGLVVPRVIQRALVRQVGAHQAERLIVAGALLEPAGALSVGLVDELVDSAEAAVATAIAWCERHLALPSVAMSGNRSMLRASLTGFFDDLDESDIQAFVDGWFGEQTQATLHALVAQLQSRKG